MTAAPAYSDDAVTVHLGDCLDILATLPDCSVDSVVTDPPAGIAFMGRDWDRDKGGRDEWVAWLASVLREALRVAKPGAHAFVWALPRTSGWTHRALEDAGWEVRDCVTHLFGSGFPKSLRVDRDERFCHCASSCTCGKPQANGMGTALKPSSEHWWLARKPLVGTVAANVVAYGTGALNIDASRVPSDEAIPNHHGTNGAAGITYGQRHEYVPGSAGPQSTHTLGRWPANVVLDDTQAAALDASTGVLTSGILAAHHRREPKEAGILGAYGSAEGERGYGDSGGAARFFPTFRYEAKAPTVERPKVDGIAHATVKPLDLMRWLVRLVTPRGGLVLDPFAGSGTTGEACVVEGFRAILIEREPTYLPLIVARLSKPIQAGLDFGDEVSA